MTERSRLNIIRTSDRLSFKKCRRAWDLGSKIRQNWEAETESKFLTFGTAVHGALETWYEPQTWGTVSKQTMQELSLAAFVNLFPQPTKASDDTYAVWQNDIELGKQMLIGYFAKSMDTDKFTPVYVEIEFEVPIIIKDILLIDDLPGFSYSCKNNQTEILYLGEPVVYQGRIDMIVKDQYGKYWVWDHKEQPIDAPILTPNGWTTMGELSVGDEVVGTNGLPTKVTGVYPKNEAPVWEVKFTDGTIVECKEDHPFTVICESGGQYKQQTLTASQIQKLPSHIHTWTPKTEAIEFTKRNVPLPMSAYALGSLIGDGYFCGSTLQFSSKSGETVVLLSNELPIGMSIDKNRSVNHTWTIKGKPNFWRQTISDLGLSNKLAAEKFIPNEYLFASIDDRVALLQGLMDTNGDTEKYRFSTMSEQLANDFQHLVWSLGGTASKSLNCDNLWKVTFQLDEFECHRLERKKIGKKLCSKQTHRTIVSVIETTIIKKMRCISVEAKNSLYLTTNFIPTHNTAASLGPIEHLEMDEQITSYIWALQHMLGIKIEGFVYNELVKQVPHKPKVIGITKNRPRGKLSEDKKQLTTYALYLEAIGENHFELSDYTEFLSFLKENPKEFYRRTTVPRSQEELQSLADNIALEAIDMLNTPSIYPNPSKFNCQYCDFRVPCLSMNEGSDVNWILNDGFTKRLVSESEIAAQ